MNTRLDDKAVIESFVAHMMQNRYPNLKVDRWPDEENRDSPDIDAVAGSFAIEHTSVDTIINQRRDSNWSMKAVGGLERELSNKLTFRLNIIIPYDGIQLGQNWSEIRESIKTWIVNSADALPDGVHNIKNALGILFDFKVRKDSNRKHGLFFSRFAPEDNSLPNRINLQFKRKAQKLKPYKNRKYTTILLVESGDIALMNESIMKEAIRNAIPKTFLEGVDQIWYADTTIPDEILFYDFTESIKID